LTLAPGEIKNFNEALGSFDVFFEVLIYLVLY